jgi:hypothetical protein
VRTAACFKANNTARQSAKEHQTGT